MTFNLLVPRFFAFQGRQLTQGAAVLLLHFLHVVREDRTAVTLLCGGLGTSVMQRSPEPLRSVPISASELGFTPLPRGFRRQNCLHRCPHFQSPRNPADGVSYGQLESQSLRSPPEDVAPGRSEERRCCSRDHLGQGLEWETTLFDVTPISYAPLASSSSAS